jgi:hypothetical protein
LIDPARTCSERRFEHVDLIGGQHEEHVGALGETVHLVEESEQQRVVLTAGELAVHCDEIDVSDDDRRGLQCPGDGSGLAHGRDGAAGEDDGRVVSHAARQVGDRVGLAGAEWPVQQQTTLGMLSRRAQPFCVFGDPDRVAPMASSSPGARTTRGGRRPGASRS